MPSPPIHNPLHLPTGECGFTRTHTPLPWWANQDGPRRLGQNLTKIPVLHLSILSSNRLCARQCKMKNSKLSSALQISMLTWKISLWRKFRWQPHLPCCLFLKPHVQSFLSQREPHDKNLEWLDFCTGLACVLKHVGIYIIPLFFEGN